MNQQTWTFRVTATAAETATVLVRQRQFAAGRPLHFDAAYSHLMPLEYAIGAVGAEIVNGFRAAAKRRRIPLDAVEAVVRADLDNPLAYLDVVGIDGAPTLARVSIKLYVGSPADGSVLEALWSDTIPKLPLARVFDTAGLLDVTLALV